MRMSETEAEEEEGVMAGEGKGVWAASGVKAARAAKNMGVQEENFIRWFRAQRMLCERDVQPAGCGDGLGRGGRKYGEFFHRQSTDYR